MHIHVQPLSSLHNFLYFSSFIMSLFIFSLHLSPSCRLWYIFNMRPIDDGFIPHPTLFNHPCGTLYTVQQQHTSIDSFLQHTADYDPISLLKYCYIVSYQVSLWALHLVLCTYLFPIHLYVYLHVIPMCLFVFHFLVLLAIVFCVFCVAA